MILSTSAVAVCCWSDSLKSAVRLRNSLEQSCVLDSDHRLFGEVAEQFDLLVVERPDLLAIDGDRTDHLVLAQHRHDDNRAGAAKLGQLNRVGMRSRYAAVVRTSATCTACLVRIAVAIGPCGCGR